MTNIETDSIIQKKSLAEEVAEQLQRQIKEGRLKEGDKLPTEPELMKVFGIGRPTIRETVEMLLNKGYVSVQQGRRTFVESRTPVNESFEQRFKRADVQDLYDVRKILEAAMAKRTALHRTGQDLKDVQEYTVKRKVSARAGLLKECFEADIYFHAAVVKVTHNEILFELYRSTAMHLQESYVHIYNNTKHFLDSQPLREKLVKYTTDKNIQEASEIAAQFWEDMNGNK